MGGENPYIGKVEVTLPSTPYAVRFFGAGGELTVQVDPENLPTKFDGLQGSLLSLASANGVKIDHACGGVCACSTCHVIVREGFETLNEATEDEEDMLDNAPGLEEFSRLACQAVPDGSQDLVVEVPSWNRNLVSEDH